MSADEIEIAIQAFRRDERNKAAAELHRIVGLLTAVGGLTAQAHERLEALADSWTANDPERPT